MEVLGNKRPKNVSEYFAWLYCKRKKLRWGAKGTKIHKRAMKTWKTLTTEEQDVFTNKYYKWQTENDKRVAAILQYAEPFMKKKLTSRENLDVETQITETRDNCDLHNNQVEQTIDSSHMPAAIDHNLFNAISEDTKQENLDDVTETFDVDKNQTNQLIDSPRMTPPINDNISNATSEITDRVYAASVIDTDIDETPGQQELTEPIRPTVKNAKELFEILQRSGTRPELATIQWKDLSKQDKAKYISAIQTMRRQYLVQYEQYLESLSSPDLFKHYIKTLKR